MGRMWSEGGCGEGEVRGRVWGGCEVGVRQGGLPACIVNAMSLLCQRWVRDSLELPVDVAIATPESLLRYRHSEQVKLSDVRHLVVDEADTMFDASFRSSTLSILQSVQVQSVCAQMWCVHGCNAYGHSPLPRQDRGMEQPAVGRGVQVTLVAATLSHDLLRVAKQHVPMLRKVTSKDLHRVLPHVEQVFLAVEAQEKAGVCTSGGQAVLDPVQGCSDPLPTQTCF